MLLIRTLPPPKSRDSISPVRFLEKRNQFVARKRRVDVAQVDLGALPVVVVEPEPVVEIVAVAGDFDTRRRC
jgi:hypothetical protein